MTTSQHYQDEVARLQAELSRTIQAQEQARRQELSDRRAEQEAEYDQSLQEAIDSHCHGVDTFRERFPETYDMALAYAREVSDGESVEVVAEELSSIMGIVDLAISEL